MSKPRERLPRRLLQEIYRKKPWRMMVCCMLLNRTTREQVDRIRGELFRRWPTPERMAEARHEELRDLIRCLGFGNKRAEALRRFSFEWVAGSWTEIDELHGIGRYAHDSWRMFVEGDRTVEPTDHVLGLYKRERM